jgi:thioredoxin 1
MSTTLIILLAGVGAFVAFIVYNSRKLKKIENVPNSQKIKTLNTKNFKTATRSGIALVDFWAPWCGPCKLMGPVLNDLAETVGDEVTVGKLNVDHNQPIANKYKVRSIPTMIMFRDGQEINRYVGVKTKKFLMAEIAKNN